MTPEEKYLKPNGILNQRSFKEHCETIPNFFFKTEVPLDVLNNFEIVEKLLAFSYYEYKFIDEAYSKAIQTLEMAMSIRYKEFFPDAKKTMFDFLIKELSKLNLFDTEFEVLKQVKDMRNFYAHPTMHSFAGVVAWHRIEFINRLINELYEDQDLRAKRKQLKIDFHELLTQYSINNGIFLKNGNGYLLFYKLCLLHINNKTNPNTYLLAAIPTFDLQNGSNDIRLPRVYKMKIKNVHFMDKCMIAKDCMTQEEIKFYSVSQNPQLKTYYNQWEKEYLKSTNKFQFESGIRFQISDILIPELQAFQRM